MSTLQKLSERHKEIARLTLIGTSNKEIAQRLQISVGTVSQIKGQELFKAFMAYLSSQANSNAVDIRKRVAQMAPAAAAKLEELLDSDKQELQLATAKDILDRAGYKPVETRATISLNALLDNGDLDAVQARLEGAKRQGLIASAEKEVIDV